MDRGFHAFFVYVTSQRVDIMHVADFTHVYYYFVAYYEIYFHRIQTKENAGINKYI